MSALHDCQRAFEVILWHPSRHRLPRCWPKPIRWLILRHVGKTMRRNSGAGGGSNKSRSRTAMTRKRRTAPKAARVASSAKTEAARLALELGEAKERQAATS